MRSSGVDLSAAPERTALAAIEWEGGAALIGEPTIGLADADLLGLLAGAEQIAIDAPFGWPEPMVKAIAAYAAGEPWPAPDKRGFRLRRTDTHVHDRLLAELDRQLWPLSPSTDRIALTAWRLAGLREAAFERSGIRFARDGTDRVIEAYPAAALALWELPRERYKSDAEAREGLLAELERQAPWLAWSPGAREACLGSDDALDAVICALLARAAALGLTERPSPGDAELARVEGWIHLPARGSLGALGGG